MEFKCPKCGNTRLIEAMSDMTVRTECSIGPTCLGTSHKPVIGLIYGDQTNEGYIEIDEYACGNGHVVVDADGVPVTEPERIVDMFGGGE